MNKSLIADAVAAWNKSEISDAMLSLLISQTKDSINLFEAFGECGLVIDGLRARLRAFEDMQDVRKRYR